MNIVFGTRTPPAQPERQAGDTAAGDAAPFPAATPDSIHGHPSTPGFWQQSIMRPATPLLLAFLLVAAAFVPACVNTSGKNENKTASEKTATTQQGAPAPEVAPAGAAEAEVKPVPEAAPPAAAPPADLVIETPPPPPPADRPASPEEQTKKTLEPKPVQAAALPQPKSEPIEPAPAPENVFPAKEPPAPARPATAEKAPEAAPAAKDKSVAVVGDSLAVGIGMTMSHRLDKAGVGCHPLGKVSTGLINKRFFDWEKRLSELVAKEKLSAVVVMMGGNDANNAIAGKQPGTPAWSDAYREKAEGFLRIASGAGVKVVWVGLPAMRDAAYNARVAAVNAAAKDACAKVGGCAYMEASDIFTDASGKYVQAKDIGGKKVSLRAKDGVHMTMTGYDLLCGQVLDKLSATGALPAGK
ncbi:SGNH/GDSL hydrolase family protein [Solidesulfovibrio alcoholivorans]|uniref:SGNH/GDSL hydrolase family protein n=1 Tax=Solidesulfovibrio alcoholivorans TaxID=81406 RepID=UPI000ADF0626|nr:DUF459 domain-containing protein [Solidesulfovibrio alcoholivorans]